MKYLNIIGISLSLLMLSSCGTASASSSNTQQSPSSVPSSDGSTTEQTQFTVGIIESPWVLGISAVDAALAESEFATLNKDVSVISCTASDENEFVMCVQQLLEDDVQAIIASLPTTNVGDSLIDMCSEKGVCLILSGCEPNAETMLEYDKCWYIEMLCEQTGELLGKAVARDFLEGVIPDNNGDDLLQYAWFGGDDTENGDFHYQYTLQSSADMGVFSNEIFSQLTACGEEAGYAMAQNLLGISLLPSSESSSEESEVVGTAPISYPTPEAVLCSDSSTARGAFPLLKEAGIYVACVASSESDAIALEQEGIHAPTWFARDEVTEYAVKFANNILNGHHVTLDTDLYLDESRKTLVTAGESENN